MLARVRYGLWSPLLPLICAGSAIACIFCIIPSDMERYWLLFAGRWTIEHGRVLESLQGSWYPSRPWVNQEWLVALATAWSQTHGLYVLVELLFAASLVAGIFFVAAECIRTRTHPLIACAQLAVTTIGAADFAQDRAQTLVWALLPALILAWRHSPWLCVPILALWANVHGSFPIAILWMLLHLDRRRIAPFVVAALATLANPLGWHLWTFTAALAHSAKLGTYVTEWIPSFQTRSGIMAAVLALAPLWVRIFAGLRVRTPLRYGDLLWLAMCTVGTILAIRYSLLLFLTTGTVLGDTFRTRAQLMPFVTRAAAVVLTLVLVAISARYFVSTPVVRDATFETMARGIDFSACAPLVPHQRVFTDEFEVGSLIDVAGGSANVDGRVDAYPLQAIKAASDVVNHPSEAEAIVDHTDAQMLALQGSFVPSSRRWRLEQRCGLVALYARSTR